ncbi:MAG TPA: glycosyltransferase family 4 protein [Candidatus Acidoferrales bacterium]|jgi:glycosyltransferase involved in cell wall biosynthesis|nr:glycosyltransferase family 4 protein [Candidatus Acidoferrales bacterium]
MARKVCVLTSAHPAFDVRIFHKECKSLARAGYEVTLIASAKEDGIHDGITLITLPAWKSRLDRFARGSRAIYKNALKVDADIYHFHDPELIPTALLLRRRGKKVIYDVHEDLPRTISYKRYIPRPLHGLISRAVEFIEDWASSRFSALVTATPAIGIRFRNVNENLAVLNNYPRVEEIESSAGPSHANREPSLLYVGMRIALARGAEEMVRSMGLLPSRLQARLKLVGSWDTPDLPASLSRIPGWDRVTFLGPLGRAEVASELQKAFAGLVILHPEPNYVTSQPVKLFEYMCAGIPVIASDFPVCREIVDEARCGILVNPLDAKEIARAIEFLLTHPKEAEEMGRRGFQAVVGRYNWAHEEKTLLRFYSELFRRDDAYLERLVGRGETA